MTQKGKASATDDRVRGIDALYLSDQPHRLSPLSTRYKKTNQMVAAEMSSGSPTPSPISSSLPELVNALSASLSNLAALSNRVPGSAIAWRYLKASHQDDPLRTVLEILLVFFIVRTYLMARTKGESSGKNFVKFSEKVNLLSSQSMLRTSC